MVKKITLLLLLVSMMIPMTLSAQREKKEALANGVGYLIADIGRLQYHEIAAVLHEGAQEFPVVAYLYLKDVTVISFTQNNLTLVERCLH